MTLPHDSDRNRVTSQDVSGTVVQIGSVQGTVHTGTAPSPTPHQLPADPRLFTDRVAEVRRLHELHESGNGSIVVVHGTGGVGKTALATHFLSAVSGSYPDGILHHDLLGFSGDAPADPGDVLDRFLRDLGVAPERIPRDLAGRAAAFRTHTHGRRIALLLDNAVSAAQVRPLLPGEGRHLVLVTTRLHLSGLRLDGAEFLELRPLDDAGAAALVERILADGRAREEPEAVARLADLCGGLPLAVCAVVSGLTTRRHQPLSRLVERLSRTGQRLHTLSAGAEMSVEAALTDSYLWLGRPARRMYRLLGLLPGRDFTLDVAAALADLPESEAEDLLTELLTASLLEETAGGRMRQHDLTRLHARAHAEADESEQAREAALDRVLGHFLTTAAAAALVLNPGRWRVAPVFDRDDLPTFSGRRQALSWLESELDVLRACVRAAHETGRHEVCWQLCESLRDLFTLRMHFEAWAETHTFGDASAEALGDPAAGGRMALALAAAQRALGDLEAAHTTYARSLRLWTATGHTLGIASSLEGCGMSELARGNPDSAVPFFSRARALYEQLGDARGCALMSRRLGRAARDAGAHVTALLHFSRALEELSAEHDTYQRARTLGEAAVAHIGTGDHRSALVSLEEAVTLAESVDATVAAAGHRVTRAEALTHLGRFGEAREELTQALSTYAAQDDPATARTQRLLDSLRPENAGPA